MKKFTAILVIAILLGGFSSNALSWDGHYHYGGGHYYRDAGWWGFGGFLTGLAIGSYVAALPPEYETVIINGVPYYYADGYYYQAGPGGYEVVAPPASQGLAGNNLMAYILGILFGVLLLLCIGLILRKLFIKEPRSA